MKGAHESVDEAVLPGAVGVDGRVTVLEPVREAVADAMEEEDTVAP